MKEGQSGLNSFNPIWLAGALKEELGEVINALQGFWQMGSFFYFVKSAIGKRPVEGFVPGRKNWYMKGVIYAFHLKSLLRGIEGVKLESTAVVFTFQEEALPVCSYHPQKEQR